MIICALTKSPKEHDNRKQRELGNGVRKVDKGIEDLAKVPVAVHRKGNKESNKESKCKPYPNAAKASHEVPGHTLLPSRRHVGIHSPRGGKESLLHYKGKGSPKKVKQQCPQENVS